MATARASSTGLGQKYRINIEAGLRRAACLSILALISVGLAGCGSTSKSSGKSSSSFINTKSKFSVSEYGVAASPRVSASKRPKKGGGRAQLGKPYRVRGKWYTPKEDPDYDRAGLASWYGPNFHGRLTANGEIYDQFHLSAAHPTFPLPSYARVTNKKNGNSVIVRVNDRGPFAHGRIIDLSNKAAELLDMKHEGVAAVRVEYVGRAPVEGDDTRYLMASYRPGGSDAPIGGNIATGVMLAMNDTPTSLPGVQAASAAMAPPVTITTSTAFQAPVTSAAAASFVGFPFGTALPAIGPVVPERPSYLAPVAALADESGEARAGLRDIGTAFWGGRVTTIAARFDSVLREPDNRR
ncbi:septal ring lytic transglycosylase RlpA family protein [Hoeflea sp.]|uniref:septal ring lytic transglycosylase RlpA family protein n=1 Tax=unclassified Hoeflea TaxID=2614931 RepID=UPI002AFFBBD2|nr:septal ring lytic transglycosylase RlpA family protein [Hoeflea sp.]